MRHTHHGRIVQPVQDDVAACFDYYAGLAEKLDTRQGMAVDVGHADFEVCTRGGRGGAAGQVGAAGQTVGAVGQAGAVARRPFPPYVSLIRVIPSGSLRLDPSHSVIPLGRPSGSFHAMRLPRHQLALMLLSCGFHYQVKVRREPLGVVALITPWNYPLLVGECGVECVGTSLKLLNPEP